MTSTELKQGALSLVSFGASSFYTGLRKKALLVRGNCHVGAKRGECANFEQVSRSGRGSAQGDILTGDAQAQEGGAGVLAYGDIVSGGDRVPERVQRAVGDRAARRLRHPRRHEEQHGEGG